MYCSPQNRRHCRKINFINSLIRKLSFLNNEEGMTNTGHIQLFGKLNVRNFTQSKIKLNYGKFSNSKKLQLGLHKLHSSELNLSTLSVFLRLIVRKRGDISGKDMNSQNNDICMHTYIYMYLRSVRTICCLNKIFHHSQY